MQPRRTRDHHSRPWPWTGIAFVVFFVASVGASSVPGSNAPGREWVAAYATHAQQVHHVATGVCLIIAGACLWSFLTGLWTKIAGTYRAEPLSRVPLVAARISGASIMIGGASMGGISAAILDGAVHEPGAGALKLGNNLGFGIVALPGMLAAAISIVYLSRQARSVGLFGKTLMIFGFVVAVALLGAIAFVPILALLIWLIVATVVLIRRGTSHARTIPTSAIPS